MVDYIPPKIPAAVVRFANKNSCRNLILSPYCNKHTHAYKDYDVYFGDFINEKGECVILYKKFSKTRFANFKEYDEIILIETPPFSINTQFNNK